jgi:hypothetical protein
MGRTIRPSDVLDLDPADLAPPHLRLSAAVLARRAARAARHAVERAEAKRAYETRRREKRKGP